MMTFRRVPSRCFLWSNWAVQLIFVCTFVNTVVISRAAESSKPTPTKNVAVITTAYFHNSHSDVIASRLRQTDTLDGKGDDSPLKLVSLCTDQRPANGISRLLAPSHRSQMTATDEYALTLGPGRFEVA